MKRILRFAQNDKLLRAMTKKQAILSGGFCNWERIAA